MKETSSNARPHERWAHFRFSVIGPLLAAPPAKGQLQANGAPATTQTNIFHFTVANYLTLPAADTKMPPVCSKCRSAFR